MDMARQLPKRTVVMIGGGMTSALAARALVNKGVDVLVLERGYDRAHTAADEIPSQRDELRWALRHQNAQNLARETYTLRYDSSEIALPARRLEAFIPGEGVGGAGNHWNGQSWRWSEYDPILRTHLENRYGRKAIPADLSVQDWGVTYAELERYHDLWEKLFGISGKAGNLRGKIQPGGNPFEAPRQNEFPQPPLEVLEAGVIFDAAAKQLGWKPFPMPAANSSGAYTNPDGMQLAQCQYCGHCERFICEASAKASPQVLLYPWLRKHKNFEVRTLAHVTGMAYDKQAKRATGVRYVDLASGEEVVQPADIVVLGAFVMSNTKLLLSSGIGAPYDPAKRSGVVGRNFCHQTTSGANVFFKDRWINPFLAAGASQNVVDEWNNDNFDHTSLGFFGGSHIFSNTTNGRPISTRPLPPGTPRWGSAWKRANADWYAHAFTIYATGSCYAHPENYLSLDPTYRDALGQPLLRMTFDWRDNEVKMSQFVTQKLADLARATGATIVGPATPRKGPYDVRVYQTTHVTGGTVMGADPATSVVSPHLQHWDAENLFVVGASVYPQNSGYNPTGPLGALALRLGDDLASYVSRPRHL
jgi:gluconate 2-dehydrogenase alpha chain